jgi:hypothetical protein
MSYRIIRKMGEQEHLDSVSLRVFADRFQEETLGLVYYPSGLGRGGLIVSYDEAVRYIDEYKELRVRNKHWLTLSAKLMIIGLLIAVPIAYFWAITTAAIVMGSAVGLYFSCWANAILSPSFFRWRLSRALGRRIKTAPLARQERVRRGLAWPTWKNMLFYGVGGPVLLFFTLHRAGPNGVVSLLGPELAHIYDIAITLTLVGVFCAGLAWLPFKLWKEHRRRRC